MVQIVLFFWFGQIKLFKFGNFKVCAFIIWEGKARTRPEILRVVLGPYMQYCPCEASEQKLGQKPESELKVIELRYCHH